MCVTQCDAAYRPRLEGHLDGLNRCSGNGRSGASARCRKSLRTSQSVIAIASGGDVRRAASFSGRQQARHAQGGSGPSSAGRTRHDHRAERDATSIQWVHRKLRPAVVVTQQSTCACVYSFESLTLTAGMRTCSGKPSKKPCSGGTVATPRAARRLAAVGLGPTQGAGDAVAEPPAAPQGHKHTQHTKSVARTPVARPGRMIYHRAAWGGFTNLSCLIMLFP